MNGRADCAPGSEGSQEILETDKYEKHINMKSPECRSSGLFGALLVQTTSGGCPVAIPAADFSLALGALAIHRSGLEAAFF